MNNEEYLQQLDAQLRPMVRKYISKKGRINQGRTVTSVQLNIENCMDDADEIQKEMMSIANILKKENNVVATDELKQQLSERYINALKDVSTYRITGNWPD